MEGSSGGAVEGLKPKASSPAASVGAGRAGDCALAVEGCDCGESVAGGNSCAGGAGVGAADPLFVA